MIEGKVRKVRSPAIRIDPIAAICINGSFREGDRLGLSSGESPERADCFNNIRVPLADV